MTRFKRKSKRLEIATPSALFSDALPPPKMPSEGLGPARTALVMVFLGVAVWYLTWRLGSFNPDALAFSIVVYAAEAFGFLTAVLHLFMCWRLSVREAPQPRAGLSVDVLVTTYNEPVDMLRRTLLAARSMDYPHQTWLLDDGDRAEMRRLAGEFGCRYISRRENTSAKAGNLNNALRFSTAEFVAVFDADHAPAKDFLVETLGYFTDPHVGFVQTPQDFYNLDSYQHRRSRARRLVWTEQSLFFRVIQRGKDCRNAAILCGSCAVLRRSALDKIGGFATGTVTEDLHTSIRFHKRGYRSVYHARSLAFGLAPANVVPFLRQRTRWGLGAMQVWRRERILLSRRLDPAQKLSYLATVLTYFDGWAKAVFYAAPVLVLTTGIMPLATLDYDFLVRFIPYYLLNFWVYEEVGRGFGRTLQIEQYNMARFAAFLWATFGLVRRRVRFSVTKKELGPGDKSRRFVVPQYLVLVLNAAAIPIGIFLYALHHTLPLGALVANIAWASVNSGLAAMVVNFSLRIGSFRRREYRFPVPVPARIRLGGDAPVLGIFDDVSSSGFRFYGAIPPLLGIGRPLEGDLFIASGRLPFSATVRTAFRDREQRVTGIGCSFEWPDEAERDRLELYLYGTDLQWALNGLGEQARTPLERLRQIFTGRPQRAALDAARWAPVLYHEARHSVTAPEVGFVSVPAGDGEPRTLATLRPLDPAVELRFRMVTRTGSQALPGTPVLFKHVQTPAAPVYLYQFAA
ncbi:MAG TPA: glycosyltransferase [Burkholderiales bacterium]|nr:glycosyltransferase [Burkholderiales bacterium]